MDKSQKTRKSLLKSASIVSGMTLLSRILGMIRDIFTAKLFGISWVWDSFVYAFMVPNFLRRLLGEGALTSAFVPLYTELYQMQGEKVANQFTNLVLSLMFIFFGGFLILLSFFFSFLRTQFDLPEKILLILGLSQFFLPYILFVCTVAILIGVLNCRKKFFVPSLLPIIMNSFWIVAVLFICPFFGETLVDKSYLLSLTICAAGLVQFLFQLGLLYRIGFRYHFNWNLKHPYLIKLKELMLPALIGFSITQLNVLIDLILAYLIGDGASSSLWYGNRLMQFPLGLFGIAVGTVLLPMISKQAAEKKIDQISDTLSFSIRTVFLIIFPATIGLIVLSEPIMILLFKRGLFDMAASVRASKTLIAYSLGLFSYSGIRLLLACFYSLKDTKTPVRVGGICLVINIVFNLIFMRIWGEAGLALSTSLSNSINFFILYKLLKKQIGSFHLVFSTSMKIILASLLMGISVYLSCKFLIDLTGEEAKMLLLAKVFGGIFIGIVSYLLFCFLFKIHEVKGAAQLLFKKG